MVKSWKEWLICLGEDARVRMAYGTMVSKWQAFACLW